MHDPSSRPHATRTLARYGIAALLFVAMIFSLTMTSYAAGGVRGNLNGSVITAKGAPVVGASVELVSPSGIYKSETDARGSFRFIGVPTDTYALFLSKKGFQPRSIQGVTIIGGGTVALGALTMKTGLKTIATVQSVAANSSFHPTQTQDTYSVSGQRVQQALGNKYSNNEDSLVLSAPGVVKTYDSTNGNGISVRGSLAVELGYQYDGVPFSAPFFDENGSQGFINGINGGSGGGLQIVSGAGDATQGNVGGGIINTIVPRGTFPAAGHADFEAGSPYYNHTLNLNYAAATDNGHFSNYASFSASRYVPNNGPVNVPSANLATGASYNPYFGTSYERHNDFVDNMVFRFGKNNHESFQILGRVAFTQQYGNYGGLTGLTYFQNPNAPGNNNLFTQFDSGFGANNSYIASLMPTLPYAPSNPAAPVLSPELVNNAPLNFVKLGYTNSLNSRTFLSLAYYNWGLFTGGSNYTTYQQNGVATGWAVYGGTRSGFIASITRAIGDSNTLTLEGSYEHAHPYWDGQQPGYSLLALDPSAVYGPGVTFGGPLSPNSGDFALPATPGQPVNPTTNPCNVTGGCYIYSQLLAAGKWTGTMPQIPTFGINYHGTTQQIWGVGLRDQWQLGNRLNLDFGARIDGEQNKFGPTPYAGISTTPSDVAPNKVGNAFIRPRAFEPRLAFSYRINNNNALRFSYGRSVEFFFGQTLGTPFNVTGVNPLLAGIPAKSGAAPYCGSGTNTQGGPGYSLNTNMPKAAANFGAPAYFFPCSSYAQEFAWFLDQNLDAPDLGGFGPPTYSDFDLAWSHQFTKGRLNGWATRLTAYTRRGFNVEQNVYLLAGPPNPITGQSSASVFTTLANGNEKTFGLEGELTTPDVHPGQHGLSGFLTVNYINELLNTPPVAGSSNLPVLQQQLLQTGTLFKAGFVPPLSAVLGLTYHFKSGMTITPSLFANDGYPFGVGRTSIGYVNGTLLSIPETNYGPNLPFAGQGQPGQAYNASYYVDPQVPGSILNPNIAASRGYAEPALAGNKNSPAQFFLNLDIEAPVSKTSTIGVQIFNLTNNNYNVPVVNTQYQPVANGVAGPGTGQLATANPLGSSYTIGSGNEYYPGGSTLPFLNSYGLGTSWNVYFRTRI